MEKSLAQRERLEEFVALFKEACDEGRIELSVSQVDGHGWFSDYVQVELKVDNEVVASTSL